MLKFEKVLNNFRKIWRNFEIIILENLKIIFKEFQNVVSCLVLRAGWKYFKSKFFQEMHFHKLRWT